MAKDNRLYGRLTLDFPDHPKIAGLSDAAWRALVEMILYSRRLLTDGFIADGIVTRQWKPKVIRELTSNDPESPSLLRVEGGYLLHDYDEHQDSKAEVEARRARNAANGSRGGQAKAKRLASKSLSKPPSKSSSENVAETETETELTPLTPHGGNDEPKSPYTADFEEWWKHYPRRVSKGDAFKAWKSLKREKTLPPLPDLIAAAEAYGKRETRPEFRKYPGGWLRDRKWEDEATNVTELDSWAAWRR